MMPDKDNADQSGFEQGIIALCQRLSGEDHKLGILCRLTGGANMESWRIDYGPHNWVLRRMQPGMEELASSTDADRSGISLESQALVIGAAITSGVTVPKIIGSLVPADALGTGFVMQRIAGETLPHKILDNPDYAPALERMTQQCARELAKIHAIPLSTLPADIDQESPAEMVGNLARRYANCGAQIPVFDLALSWLSSNLPTPRLPAFLHGDFRMGNLMIDHQGIAGVLDWELGHIGDPTQDLAYLCMPSWRFGHYDQPVGGFGQLDELLTLYRDLTGQKITVSDVNFWMVLSSMWWGLSTIRFAELWRSGQDASLERAVVGRRTSETEIDLLLMLEDTYGLSVPLQSWAVPDRSPPRGETHSSELLAALISWDEEHVFPNSAGRDLFQARVARNALRILSRDAAYGPQFSRNRAARLRTLGLTEEELCSALRAGSLDSETLVHLRLDLLERLQIDQPSYAGFKSAMAKWVH